MSTTCSRFFFSNREPIEQRRRRRRRRSAGHWKRKRNCHHHFSRSKKNMKKVKQSSLHQRFLFLPFLSTSHRIQPIFPFLSSQSSLRDAIHPSTKNQKILPGTLPKRTKGRLAKTKQRFRRGSNSRPFRLYFPDMDVFCECKRNVMGHYTTKPLFRQTGKLNIKVNFGRLDKTCLFAGWYCVYATYSNLC